MSSPILGPVPPYSNPPINPQYFQPSAFQISDILIGSPTIVLTSKNNNFVINQQVRFIIPPGYGARQLNGLTGYVIAESTSSIIKLLEAQCDGTNVYSANMFAPIISDFPNMTMVPGTFSLINSPNAAIPTFYRDDGAGNIIFVSGVYTISSGTINYTTGDLILNFTVSPPNLRNNLASFTFNLNLNSNGVTVNIDSSNFDPFIPASLAQVPQILSIGDISSGATNSQGNLATSTLIPGSFQNISPL